MNRPPPDRLGWVVALACACLALWFARLDAKHQGESDSRLVALRHSVRRVDTLYRRDTIRLREWRTKWDTLTLGSPPAIGAGLTAAPAWTPREVLVIATADSTINACLAVAQTCEERVAVRDSLVATYQSRERRSAWRLWAERAGWVGLLALLSTR